MSCSLDFTPYRTKQEALANFKNVTGAFGVSQISNDTRWWYILSKEGNTYKVNYKDGVYTVPSSYNTTFNILYSRLSDYELTNQEQAAEAAAYIEETDLINNFVTPTPIAPKAIIKNKSNIKD